MRIVADTGPILHLHEAGALDFLSFLDEICITPFILHELRANAPFIWKSKMPAWIKIHHLTSGMNEQSAAWQNAGILHRGESEALVLAMALKPDWFITDDAAARLVAESQGMEVHGSIGIILWLAIKKHIDQTQAEICLKGLENSSLWMSAKVRTEAWAALNKIFS